jgi:hypothetical protein
MQKTIIYYQMSTNIIIDNVAFIIHTQQVDIYQFYDFSYFMQTCVQTCFKVSIGLNMFWMEACVLLCFMYMTFHISYELINQQKIWFTIYILIEFIFFLPLFVLYLYKLFLKISTRSYGCPHSPAAHAWPFAHPPIDTSGNFPADVSAESH